MTRVRAHLIASDAEAELYRDEIRAYLAENGWEAGLRFGGLSALSVPGADCGAEDVFLLLSIYDLDAVRTLYSRGVMNVHCPAAPSVWLTGRDAERAKSLEERCLRENDLAGLKRLNRIRMILSYLNRETEMRSFPVQIQIETTSRCNAECIMCGHFIYKNEIARHMDPELPEAMDPYLKYAETVILHGYGEPFLYPGMERMLEKYREYGLRVVTNTNLSVLSENVLRMMPELFSEITVSIDGCTKEVYEGIRKGLSFETLVQNLERLREGAPDVKKILAMVIMRQNLHQIPDMVRFAKRYGFGTVNFIALGSSPYAGNEADEVWNYPNVLRRQLKEAAGEARALGVELEMPLPAGTLESPVSESDLAREWEKIREKRFFPYGDEQRAMYERHVAPRLNELEAAGIRDHYSRYTSSPLEREALRPDGGRMCTGCCDSVLFRPYISLDGRVFACCLHTKRYMGEIGEDGSFGSIWNNDLFREMRSVFYGGKLPEYCRSCSFMDNDFLCLLKEDGGARA
ncbi:MAG: radical SAM protein [Lachnospiraceae bacterium]|nr:radical SAM protein [Lachnospiraceae bacterium]